jgi:hypothetical protein
MSLARVLVSLLAFGTALPACAFTPKATTMTARIASIGTVLQLNQTDSASPRALASARFQARQEPIGLSDRAPFHVHTVAVPAGGTAEQNGRRLLDVIKTVEVVASPTNPYLIKLDTGYFDVGAGAVIYPGISLRGAGTVSTFITSSGTALYFINLTDDTGISFRLSDMTVTAKSNPVGRPVASPNINHVVIDHVHLLAGVAGVTAFNTFVSGASLLITNSIINSPLHLSNLYRDPTVRMKVIGTEVDSFQINAGTSPATLACFATYNANRVPYSHACN